MKRWVVVAVAAALVVGVASGVAASSLTRSLTVKYSDIKLSVNGKTVDTGNSEPFVVVDEGRTYVPARYLAEALGAKVSWDATTSTVAAFTPDYVSSGTSDGVFTVGAPYYGVSMQFPTGTTMVPRTADALFLTDGTLGQVGVFRQLTDSTNTMAKLWSTYKTLLTGVQFGSPKIVNVAGATESWEGVGTGKTSSGVTFTITARFVIGPKNTWLLQAITRGSYSQESVDRALDSFKFSE